MTGHRLSKPSNAWNSQGVKGSGRKLNRIFVISESSRQNEINSDSYEKCHPSWSCCGKENQLSTFFDNRYITINNEDTRNGTGLLGILILLASVPLSMLMTCWPHHNILQHPEYWYESIFMAMIGYTSIFSIGNTVEENLLIKTDSLLSWKACVKQFTIFSLGNVIVFATIYFFWTHSLGYRYPMPFTGQIQVLMLFFFFVPLSIWLQFPSSIKKQNPTVKKQISLYIRLLFLRLLTLLVYTKLPAVFLGDKVHLQWLLVIFLPLWKKFCLWWNEKMALKISLSHKFVSKINSIIWVGFAHSFSITLVLASTKIHLITACLLMLSDFMFNLWSLMKILRQKRSPLANQQDEEQDTALSSLAVREYLEVLIPSMYCLSFIVAYYGPNAELIGNVRCAIWTFEKVSDLFDKLKFILLFIVIDGIRGVSFGLVLWYFRNLNMYSAYCRTINVYGKLILFSGTRIINAVRIFYVFHIFGKLTIKL